MIGALNQIADAVVDGTDPATAIQEGLAALEANPDYQAAINAIVPKAVNSLLNTAAVRQAGGSSGANHRHRRTEGSRDQQRLHRRDRRPGGRGLGGDFPSQADGWGTLRPGHPRRSDRHAAERGDGRRHQAVLRDPGLQVALGTSIGTGIGSLFGDNIIGLLVGGVAGFTATIVIAVASGLTGLFTAGDPLSVPLRPPRTRRQQPLFPLLPAPVTST